MLDRVGYPNVLTVPRGPRLSALVVGDPFGFFEVFRGSHHFALVLTEEAIAYNSFSLRIRILHGHSMCVANS